MNYLLDANTFIEAKNRYYSMAVCPGYWEWILKANQHHGVTSISLVRDELMRGNDELSVWATSQKMFFASISDAPTQTALQQVAIYVMSIPNIKPEAQAEFMSGADPWLIAKAIVTGAVVVTHEKLDRAIKRKVLIPNVCEQFKVPYINTFELLETLNAQFILQP